MAPKDLINRTIDAGRGVGQRSQDRIEGIVGQLQRMSEEQLDQVVALMGELRDRSVLSGEQVASAVDRRVRDQFTSLGLATKADVDRLEAKLDALTDSATTTVVPKKKPTTKKAAATKSTVKKTTVKKAAAKKAITKKASAKKASAKKASAKKVAPRKSAVGNTPGAPRSGSPAVTSEPAGGSISGSRSAG